MAAFFGSLFQKKAYPPPDFTLLGTDMHSHLLPGIDDGAATLEDSLLLIRELQSYGYKKLITTPHIMSDFYKNTPEIILNKLKEVREALIRENISIEIDAAAEYYLDFDLVKKIKTEKLLTFGKNFLLFELSYMNPPDNLKEAIFEMHVAGYIPVLAHPERYPYWFSTFDEFRKLKESGVLFQLNLNSLSGFYSEASKHIAEKMISEKMIDFVGTDVHHVKHLEGLKRTGTKKYLDTLMNSGKLLNDTI